MKRMLSFLVSLVLIVLCLCASTIDSFALSDTPESVTLSGSIPYPVTKFSYSASTSASKTSASAKLTFGKQANLYASIEATLIVGGRIQFNDDDDLFQGTTVSASVTNIYYDENDGVSKTGEITSAVSEFRIGSVLSLTDSIPRA